MYPPKYHLENDFKNIIKTIKHFPLATIISVDGEDCHTTHIPLVYREDGTEFGTLAGHIDKFNPQCAFLNNKKITAVFHGPNTYISPNTYTTLHFPTWNYIKVHIGGVVKVIEDSKDVRKMLHELTAYMEDRTSDPYILRDDDPRLDHFVNYVVGFEIRITKWEGKFKLSQDKIPVDTAHAKEKLIADSKLDLRNFLEGII